MADSEEAKMQDREIYINQALNDIERAYNVIFDISQNPDNQDLEFDDDVMFDTPITNFIPIEIHDQEYMRKVLSFLYDKSGILKPSPGGRDEFGNAWIKMQFLALTLDPEQPMIMTEAILWILHPNVQPQDNPIEYAKYARIASGNLQSLPTSWINLQQVMMPQQSGQ